MLLGYCLGNSEMVPVVPIITGILLLYSNGQQTFYLPIFFSISFPFFPFILSSSTSRNHFVRGRLTVLFPFDINADSLKKNTKPSKETFEV